MNHLNYFHAYQSKQDWHEDQLTRAYLVLLRFSHHAFVSFYDYCFNRAQLQPGEQRIGMNEWMEQGWQADTQRTNPNIGTEFLLSVLITNTDLSTEDITIERSGREARYDGIITFGDKLTMIIETKPRAGNVSTDQLNPSKNGLEGDTKVYKKPVILLWKDIIIQLTQLYSLPSLNGAEKMMIDDFLSFIDVNFTYLNPFDRYDLCKGNTELIYRRTSNILRAIAADPNTVQYHYGWGWYIQTSYPHIKMLGLIYERNEKGWWLNLCLYYGDSQNQAKNFYRANPNIGHLSADWETRGNFHVQYITSNLVWFQSNDAKHYLDFWKANVEKIYQVSKKDVPEYLTWLQKENVIEISDSIQTKLKAKFYDTAMPTLNICPGFGLEYTVTGEQAETMDKNGMLEKFIADKFREGLKVINKTGDEFLKNRAVNIKLKEGNPVA